MPVGIGGSLRVGELAYARFPVGDETLVFRVADIPDLESNLRDWLSEVVTDQVQREREECAKFLDEKARKHGMLNYAAGAPVMNALLACAKAIRDKK